MKSGAILANSGHFNVEIDVEGLEKLAADKNKSDLLLQNITYQLTISSILSPRRRPFNKPRRRGRPPERSYGYVVLRTSSRANGL